MTPALLPHLLDERARLDGDRVALSDKERALTWSEVRRRCGRLAGALTALGVVRGERVGVWMEAAIEQAVAYFAIQQAGGISVMLNAALRAEQALHIRADCGVETLIMDGKRFAEFGPTLSQVGARRALVVDAEPDVAKGAAWEALLGARQAWGGFPEASPPAGIPADPAHIIYTSGSTGRPKGIVVTHRNALDGARIVSGYTGLRADETILGALPLNFDYGLNQWLNAAWTGSRYHIHRFFMPNALFQEIEREQITVVAGMPPIWSRLLDARLAAPERRDLSSVRVVTNTGGRVPVTMTPRLTALFPQARLYLMYGLTEAFRSTFLPPEQTAIRPDSIGRAIPEVEIEVVRPDGAPCAVGEVGELVHRGALIAQGYWGDAEQTGRVFRPAPGLSPDNAHLERAVYSGDLVHRDAEGFLYYQGRRDQQIKTKGYRVSPEEAEALLTRIEGIAQAVVAPFEQEADTGLRAFVTLADATLDERAIRSLCRKHGPFYLVPDQVVVRQAFPLTANGKVDRSRVVQEFDAASKDADV